MLFKITLSRILLITFLKKTQKYVPSEARFKSIFLLTVRYQLCQIGRLKYLDFTGNIMIKNKLQELFTIIRESLKRVYYPVLIIPILVAAISFWIVEWQMPLESYESWQRASKSVWEAMALILLKGAVAVTVLRMAVTKFKPFSIWLFGLTTVFLMREIHWDFMSEGVYVGLMIFLAIAWFKYDLFKEYMQQRFFLTMFTMVFFTYFIAVTFDGQWWTATRRMDQVGQLAEEILEVFGHVLVIVMVIFSRKQIQAPDEESQAAQIPAQL